MSMHFPYQKLIQAALDFMAIDSPSAARYITYVRAIQSQIGIIQGIENRPLTAKDWISIAIELGRRALERDIGAKRIAESIYPLVDGSGQFSNYSGISASAATNLLLIWSGTFSLRPEEKALLVDVIAELQKLYITRTNPIAHS
jgi:hypothetical protein